MGEQNDYERGVDVAEISRPAKGRFRKIRRQRRGAPQSAAILRAKLGGRREGRKDEKFENHAVRWRRDQMRLTSEIT